MLSVRLMTSSDPNALHLLLSRDYRQMAETFHKVKICQCHKGLKHFTSLHQKPSDCLMKKLICYILLLVATLHLGVELNGYC